jgi:hypothetical protein
MYGRNKAMVGGMRGTSGSSKAGESGRTKPMIPNAGKPMQAKPRKPKPMATNPARPSGVGLPLGMKHGGLYHQDEDVAMASKPRMGKAMGGQPSYASGEMPTTKPN